MSRKCRIVSLLAVAAVAAVLWMDAELRAKVISAASSGLAEGWDASVMLAQEASRRFARWVEVSYARRPAVMLGLSGVLLLPVLLGLGLVLHRRRARPAPAAPVALFVAPVRQGARIELEGAGIVELPAGRDFVQLGRQDDNDICIEQAGVERYHAVIERSEDMGFTITDVSGIDGEDGLRVNGQRRQTAVLNDGDTLELGRARMRFATAA